MTGQAGPLPSGTVTFLRTDVEGSMALARTLGSDWDTANSRHLQLLRALVARHGGTVVRTEGDALFAAFGTSASAVAAAVEGQRALAGQAWPGGMALRVRMGLHSGDADLAGDDYGGVEVSRAARVAAVGHGGQILLSRAAYELTVDAFPDGVTARQLGDFVLKDVPRPETLYQLQVPDLPADFPPLRAGRAAAGNLEPRLTSFVGREAALEELTPLLRSSRLLTLTGPGGIGKSSLAVELARAVAGEYPDGAWFVPLAALGDPVEVPALIARTLGLFDGARGSAADALPEFVAGRSMLLVLDNFEHLLAAASDVAALLLRSPATRILATSRAPLHLAGEQEYPVSPLVDSDQARRLFGDRARAVNPRWDSDTAAPIVDEICAMLDGLPLGIELAAARVGMLPPAALRDRLAGRLALPGRGRRDAPTRQRTLEAAIGWSHDLLDPTVQRTFHRLSVCEDHFNAELAAAVASVDVDAVWDQLAELVDQSLLDRDVADTESRFRMLRTINAYAAARLAEDGDEEAVRRRHAQFVTQLGRRFLEVDGTAEEPGWIRRLTTVHADIRAAVLWTIQSGDYELACELVASFWRLWQAGGFLAEGRTLAEAALAIPGAPAVHPWRVWALGAAGSLAYWQQDTPAAARRYAEQVRSARELADDRALADALFNFSSVAVLNADVATMETAVAEVRAFYQRLGDERGMARTDWSKAMILIDQDRGAEAAVVLRGALARFAALGDTRYHAMNASTMAWAEFGLGHQDQAMGWFAQGLRENYDNGDLATATISLQIGAVLALMAGDASFAPRLLGAFDALSKRYAVQPPAGLSRFIRFRDPAVTARSRMSAEAYELEYAAGTRMTLAEAVALVVALVPGAGVTPAGELCPTSGVGPCSGHVPVGGGADQPNQGQGNVTVLLNTTPRVRTRVCRRNVERQPAITVGLTFVSPLVSNSAGVLPSTSSATRMVQSDSGRIGRNPEPLTMRVVLLPEPSVAAVMMGAAGCGGGGTVGCTPST